MLHAWMIKSEYFSMCTLPIHNLDYCYVVGLFLMLGAHDGIYK